MKVQSVENWISTFIKIWKSKVKNQIIKISIFFKNIQRCIEMKLQF